MDDEVGSNPLEHFSQATKGSELLEHPDRPRKKNTKRQSKDGGKLKELDSSKEESKMHDQTNVFPLSAPKLFPPGSSLDRADSINSLPRPLPQEGPELSTGSEIGRATQKSEEKSLEKQDDGGEILLKHTKGEENSDKQSKEYENPRKRKIEDTTENQDQRNEVLEKPAKRDENPSNGRSNGIPNTPSKIQPSDPSQSDRMVRFKALQSRASVSQKSNLADARAEASRASVDPARLTNLSRKAAAAAHNLLKADTEEEGGSGAFERKRAWDYTIEESEKWDERMAAKARNRNNVAFQDYSSEASKIYERQMRDLEKRELKGEMKNKDEYELSKARLIEKAAQSGGLEVVETDNGDLVAIDKDGTFYSTLNSVDFVESRPKRENVDRLVKDLQKGEEIRLKKRKERLGADANDGDITFINDKNKLFNQKLARFYDKYTADIRDSFERGTAI